MTCATRLSLRNVDEVAMLADAVKRNSTCSDLSVWIVVQSQIICNAPLETPTLCPSSVVSERTNTRRLGRCALVNARGDTFIDRQVSVSSV